jgi:hypothetical protein
VLSQCSAGAVDSRRVGNGNCTVPQESLILCCGAYVNIPCSCNVFHHRLHASCATGRQLSDNVCILQCIKVTQAFCMFDSACSGSLAGDWLQLATADRLLLMTHIYMEMPCGVGLECLASVGLIEPLCCRLICSRLPAAYSRHFMKFSSAISK